MNGKLFETWLTDEFDAATHADPVDRSFDVDVLLRGISCGYYSDSISKSDLRPPLLLAERELRLRLLATGERLSTLIGTDAGRTPNIAAKLQQSMAADRAFHADVSATLVGEASAPGSVLRFHSRARLLELLHNEHLRKLVEGGDVAYARAVAERRQPDLWRSVAQDDAGTPAHDRLIMRIVAAEKVLAAHGRVQRDDHGRLGDVAALLAMPTHAAYCAMNLREDSMTGGEAEVALAKRGALRIRRLPQCATAEDAVAQAHGLLRNPAMFATYAHHPGARRVAARVNVTPDALCALVMEEREQPTWRGIRLMVESPQTCSDSPGRIGITDLPTERVADARCPISPPDVQATGRVLSVGAQQAALIGEHSVTVTYVTDIVAHLSEEPSTGQRQRNDVAVDALRALIPQELLLDHDAPARAPETLVVELLRSERFDAPRLASRDDLLGPDRCSHPNARWEATGRGDFEALQCPRCMRQRLVSRPTRTLLRSPVGLDILNAHRLLAGEAPFATLDEARAWRKETPDDPGAYATDGNPASQRKNRPPTLRGALSRR